MLMRHRLQEGKNNAALAPTPVKIKKFINFDVAQALERKMM
jgi:hypothetical protein